MSNISLVTFIRELPLDKIVKFVKKYFADEIAEMKEARRESKRTGHDCADFDQDGVEVDVLYYNLILDLVLKGDEDKIDDFSDFDEGEELLYDRLLESDPVKKIGNGFTWFATNQDINGRYSFRL